MTAVKVSDGIALAADSAIVVPEADGTWRIYENAEKLFRLHDSLPIAAMSYGAAAVGESSVQFLVKQMCQRLTEQDDASWCVDSDNYRLEDIASKVTGEFHRLARLSWGDDPSLSLGLVFAGYSSGSQSPELWESTVNASSADPPQLDLALAEGETGVRTYAQAQVADRLINGWDDLLVRDLSNSMASETFEDLAEVLHKQRWSVGGGFMPLPDAVALSRYLVEVTIGGCRFVPSAGTVRGPIDVASISHHNGFTWVARKGYPGSEWS